MHTGDSMTARVGRRSITLSGPHACAIRDNFLSGIDVGCMLVSGAAVRNLRLIVVLYICAAAGT